MLMLAPFDAAGVLVPAPQPPKIFRPGRAVRHAIFFALSVMVLFLSYSLIIEQSAFMAITAIGPVTTWVTPLQTAHGVIGIHSAGARSIPSIKSWITHARPFSSSPGLSTSEHALCHRLQAGMYPCSQ